MTDRLINKGEYDAEKGRFDHHQRTFNDTFNDKFTIKLSSAGLVYKHFGKSVISHLVKALRTSTGETVDISETTLDLLYAKIYEGLILAFDGIDNGVSMYPDSINNVKIEARYKDSTGIASRVSHLNPRWNETVSEAEVATRFAKAMELCGSEFSSKLENLVLAWLPARHIVVDAFKNRASIHESGKIMVLDHFCPWKSHLYGLEAELKVCDDEKPIYVLYQDDSGKWYVLIHLSYLLLSLITLIQAHPSSPGRSRLLQVPKGPPGTASGPPRRRARRKAQVDGRSVSRGIHLYPCFRVYWRPCKS